MTFDFSFYRGLNKVDMLKNICNKFDILRSKL